MARLSLFRPEHAVSLPPMKGPFVSRLWSRFGVRASAVALLLVGVTGGYYLAENREAQQQAHDAQLVAQAEQVERELLRRNHITHLRATVEKRTAEREANAKVEEAAKAAAARAKKAEEAVTRKKEREEAAARAEAEAKAAAEARTKPYDGPIPESCNQYSGNRAIGCALLLEAGFALDQMPCLDQLWTKESGWNHKAQNPSSGAYGIPQARPGNKMASSGADWQTSPATQIRWGLGYIQLRYGSPCSAWAHSQSTGWY